MSKRISMAMAVLGAVGTLTGCNLEQPAAGCFVQDGTWQAKYILKDPSQAGLSCGAYKGETVGVRKYTDPEAPADKVAANEASRVALRPTRLAGLYAAATYKVTTTNPDGTTKETTISVPRADPATATDATALSTTLAQQTDDEGLCLSTGFNTATVSAPATSKRPEDGGGALTPAATFSYTYENVEVYSAPSAPGTQLRGTVKINNGTCTAEYEMWALWPARACDPAQPISDSNCGATVNINPDFEVACDPDLKRCVPARRPPSFKEGAIPL